MVSQSIVIQNALPQIDSIDVSSTSPNLGDTLTCTATASDLDDVDQGNLQISIFGKMPMEMTFRRSEYYCKSNRRTSW